MTPLKSVHPEAQHGEVFLTNSNLNGYLTIGWLTKRRGTLAYDAYGELVPHFDKYDFRPVFVQASELAAAKIHSGIVSRRKLIGDP
jgi:hypothetical protein